MSQNWKKVIETFFGVTISGVLLYFGFRQIQISAVLEVLRMANYWWIVPAIFCYLGALLMRTVRWKILIWQQENHHFVELLPAMAIGRASNNLLPLRLGEGVRVYLLSLFNHIRWPFGAATLIVERVFDGIAMLVFIVSAAIIGEIPSGPLQGTFILAFLLFGFIIGLLTLFVFHPTLFMRLVDFFTTYLVPQKFRSSVKNVFSQFFEGFLVIQNPLSISLVLLCSVAVWVFELGVYRLVMNCFGFGVDFHTLLLMSAASNLGTALPSGAANLGTFDSPGIWVLTSLANLSNQIAAPYMLTLHATLWVTETGIGMIFMAVTGISMKQMLRPDLQGELPS